MKVKRNYESSYSAKQQSSSTQGNVRMETLNTRKTYTHWFHSLHALTASRLSQTSMGLLSTKQASSISNSYHSTDGPRTYGLCWATSSTSRLTTRLPCLNKFEDFIPPSQSRHSAGSFFLLKAWPLYLEASLVNFS